MRQVKWWLFNIMILSCFQFGWSQDSLRYAALEQDSLFSEFLASLEKEKVKLKIDLLNTDIFAGSNYKVHSIVDQIDDKKILNWDKVLNESEPNNNFFSFYHSDLIGGTFYRNKMTFGLALGIGMETHMRIPYSTISAGVEGNGSYLDQDLFLGLDANHTSWNEIRLSFAYSIKDLKPWINLSIANGYQSLYIEGGYSIFTPQSLELIEVDRSLSIESYKMFDYEDSDNVDFNYNQPFHNFLQFKNAGWMVDVGLDYTLYKHDISIFVEDINSFSWKGDRYIAEGEEEFIGVDISDSLDESIQFETQDTLDSILGLNASSDGNFNSSISTKIGLSYQYQITEDLNIGLRGKYFYHANYDFYYSELSVGYQFTDWFQGSLNYTINSYSYDNVGFRLRFTFPHYDLHISTNNLPALITPYDFRQVGLNFGMSLKL